jgi:hypothetical protein
MEERRESACDETDTECTEGEGAIGVRGVSMADAGEGGMEPCGSRVAPEVRFFPFDLDRIYVHLDEC